MDAVDADIQKSCIGLGFSEVLSIRVTLLKSRALQEKFS